MVTVNGAITYCDVDDEYVQEISAIIGATLLEGQSSYRSIVAGDTSAAVLFSLLKPPPAILVLGAGLDAGPVVRFARELGWKVTVQDHRPAYIESGKFIDVAKLAGTIDLDRFAATIVMSHHLTSDREYLKQLATSKVGYIGLLGPEDRRKRLLEELGDHAERLQGRLHGPAGLDIGGRGPASIALSIIAEMHRQIFLPPDR
jgi:xanthine/CO dehydrogenase XdhC/CoxF family maturation factor